MHSRIDERECLVGPGPIYGFAGNGHDNGDGILLLIPEGDGNENGVGFGEAGVTYNASRQI